MRKILFFTGLGALGLGAYLFYKRQLDILYDFKYSINDIKILERTADKITLQITISVRNESELDFYIKGYDLNVLINNEVVSNVKNSNMNLFLKGMGQSTTITFNADFSPKNYGLLDIVSELITTLGDTLITIRGTAKISKGIFQNWKQPIDETWKLNEFL